MKTTKNCAASLYIRLIIIACCITSLPLSPGASAKSAGYNYAAVISSAAYSDVGWGAVADSLVAKHNKTGTARLFKWNSSVNECATELALFRPDYIGFIARPATECNTAFVVAVSRMSRSLDEDPYGDAIWGIITGYEASDALRAISESLTVKTVLAASGGLPYEPPIERFYQAIGMDCNNYTKTDYLFAGNSGKIYTEDRRPNGERDRIKLVAPWLNAESLEIEIEGEGTIQGPVDCIITGGHGNVNLWQCHYPEAESEGFMQSSAGQLFGVPASGSNIPINAPTPKIYWCASNCLMGNPDNTGNFVYAAFHSGHAVQMFGFMNNASAGDEFMAWGVYDRVTKAAGKYTLAEGFFLSNNNAKFELMNPTGLMNTHQVETYMDSTVFYGDPAADVTFHRFGSSSHALSTNLSVSGEESQTALFELTVKMVAHNLEFGEGYCYQFRPIAKLPVRIDPATVTITRNEGDTAVITDNLVIWEILSTGETLYRGDSMTLSWSAVTIDDETRNRHPVTARRSMNHDIVLKPTHNGQGTTLAISGIKAGAAVVRIVDCSGRTRSLSRVSSRQAERDVHLPVKLAPGVYGVAVEQDENLFYGQCVVLR